MRFQPKTEKELNEERLLPEGEYPFQISGAEDKISKSGNEMIELTVRVFKPDGSFNLVTDWLLESMMFKLLHCCQACGLEDQYNAGSIKSDMFIGKEGMLKLKIVPEGDYPAKNAIKDYIPGKKAEIPADNLNKTLDSQKNSGDDLSDEIPF